MRAPMLIVVLTLSACQPPPSVGVSETDQSAAENAIRAQAEGLILAQNALDTDAFVAALSPSHIVLVANQTRWESYDSVAAAVESTLSGLDAFDSGWTDLGVTVLSADAGLSHGVFWVRQTAGTQITSFSTVYWTALHQRQADGSWKITRIHQSFPDPTVVGSPGGQ